MFFSVRILFHFVKPHRPGVPDHPALPLPGEGGKTAFSVVVFAKIIMEISGNYY
jgi:hypothetical protein